MTEIEKKALALVNEVRASHGLTPYENLYATPAAIEALCRAIEQHEAFRQEVSDGLLAWFGEYELKVPGEFARFIIPKPDPLVEVLDECGFGVSSNAADDIRAALAARGLKIVEDK